MCSTVQSEPSHFALHDKVQARDFQSLLFRQFGYIEIKQAARNLPRRTNYVTHAVRVLFKHNTYTNITAVAHVLQEPAVAGSILGRGR